jgi:DNA repair/transcription protein MET18/MMS19
VEEQLDRVMRPLLQLTSRCPSAAVREAAVQTLAALLRLPAARLAPHRADVMRCLDAALDDPKRHVRRAAVTCRQAWTLV